jgi:hypothetical protein
MSVNSIDFRGETNEMGLARGVALDLIRVGSHTMKPDITTHNPTQIKTPLIELLVANIPPPTATPIPPHISMLPAHLAGIGCLLIPSP